VDETAIRRVNHPNYSAGVVISQYPAADEEVAPDSKVSLVVSSGYKDVDLKINLPQVDAQVDLDVYVEGTLVHSQDGIHSKDSSPLTVSVSQQKSTYTVSVELSEAGDKNFKVYAVFVVDGENGRVISSDYRSFTFKPTTTTKPVTTTTASTTEAVTTTTTEPITTTTTQTQPDQGQEGEEGSGEEDETTPTENE